MYEFVFLLYSDNRFCQGETKQKLGAPVSVHCFTIISHMAGTVFYLGCLAQKEY